MGDGLFVYILTTLARGKYARLTCLALVTSLKVARAGGGGRRQRPDPTQTTKPAVPLSSPCILAKYTKVEDRAYFNFYHVNK